MLHEWLELLASERWNLAGATAAHLELVVEAVLLAVLAGVPLGILAARSRSVERAAIGVTSVLQTIPSLALLGFLLIAFRGQIGKAPALAALVLYSLLPIVKNTILGLRSIDPGVQEASRRPGDDGISAAVPGRATPCRADRAGRGARGDGRGCGHGDHRGGHWRSRAGKLHLSGRCPFRHAANPDGLGSGGPARPGLRCGPGRDRAQAGPDPAGAITTGRPSLSHSAWPRLWPAPAGYGGTKAGPEVRAAPRSRSAPRTAAR